jgi:hypothetical protein
VQVDQRLGEELVGRVQVLGQQPRFGELAVVPADTHTRVRAALNAPAACSPPADVRAAGGGY